ncbi:hypothetical protein ACKKBF_B35375 [Auxenochlorella protothecoides x Auxenochlorella symbiontica]
MAAQPRIPKGGSAMLSTGQLHAVSAKKSFDYRVLHHLLCGLCGIERNNVAPLFEFLALDEWLVDIGDDLVDYEDDVLRNSFNIYRGYVHIFGATAPLELARHIGELEGLHAQALALLTHAQRRAFLKRKDAAAEGPGALRWVMPTPILDEAAYRSQ